MDQVSSDKVKYPDSLPSWTEFNFILCINAQEGIVQRGKRVSVLFQAEIC